MQHKPFGMSVLTFGMAKKLKPIVKERARIRKIEESMKTHQVDSVIAANVLSWQKQNHRRIA